MTQGIIVLVVAEQAALADSLAALLMAMPGVTSTVIVTDGAQVLDAVSRHSPPVVLLAQPGVTATLRAIKAAQASTFCIALAGDLAQQQAAQAAGADLALVSGFPAAGLYQAILGAIAGLTAGDRHEADGAPCNR